MVNKCLSSFLLKAMYLFLPCLFAHDLTASEITLHFWPTEITRNEPEITGSLYAWPDFKVILQSKNEKSKYVPALINDSLAKELDEIFHTPMDSPIKFFRDKAKGLWGLAIPGGEKLTRNNEQLIEPMLDGFVSCLQSLNQNELEYIENVIYAPNSSISNEGQLLIDEQQRDIANKMYTNYTDNRCTTSKTVVPELLKNLSRNHLSGLLTGKTIEWPLTDGALLVLTSLFNDLLFSKNGLFVRVVLAKIRQFIQDRMDAYPGLNNTNWLAKHYASFLDIFLLNNKRTSLSKKQYLSLAKICDINKASDIFNACPLNYIITTNKFSIVHLFIDSLQSTYFLRAT